MSRCSAIVLAFAATWASISQAIEPTDWRESLPADWLAVAVIDSPEATFIHAGSLLEPWGRKTDWLADAFDTTFPRGVFADRPWVFALVEGDSGSIAPMVLAPTDDFGSLCDTLDADVADDIAVAVVGGFDVALIDRSGWAQLTLLDSTPSEGGRDAGSSFAPLDRLPDVGTRLAVSPRGTRGLAEMLAARRRGQLEIGRGRMPRWAWPTGFNALVDQLAPYAPLAAELSELDEPIAIGVAQRKGAWVATCVLPITSEPSTVESIPPMTAGKAIATLQVSDTLPSELINLAISVSRCRPDDIDAPDYPQPQWDDFAEACHQLAEGLHGASCVLTLPNTGQPVATNQSATFRWESGASKLGDALGLLVVRWNQVIDAAKTRTPLRVAIEPFADRGGWRLSVDLFAGFNLKRSPDIEALFDRYYGSDVLSFDVLPAGEASWTVSAGPSESERGNTIGSAVPSDRFATGELRLDRWFAWLRQIEDVTMGDAIGYRVRPPMAESPPATLRVWHGDSMRVDATLPDETYEAAVAYWRAKKVKP